MKAFTKFNLLVLSMLCLLFSCQQEEILDVPSTDNNVELNTIFKYKGVVYNYSTSDKAKTLYDELQENPTLATYVPANGTIEYFDSHEELIKEMERLDKEDMLSPLRSTGPYYKASISILIFHDNINNSGTQGMIYLDRPQNILSYYYIDWINGVNWDQKIRSFELGAAAELVQTREEAYPRPYVTFFDQTNCVGASITFGVDIDKYMSNMVPRLDKYGWDQKIRSIRMYFSYTDLT
ncbi:MAG: hypothetical protein E6772_04975 [Dysgonomonas sp.]|nr:hypothetical protein [Dysgonomonas sp.]